LSESGERRGRSNAERQAAYRARKREAERNALEASERNSETPSVTDGVTSVTPERPRTLRGLMAAAQAGEVVLTEHEEQQIRNHFGFTSSEKRTYLERCGVAEAIHERLGPASLDAAAFPVQTPGDLTPTSEERGRLG